MPVTVETIEKLLKRIDELLASVEDLSKQLEEARQQHEMDEAKIVALEKKIEELTARKVKKDSHNSSMPPSSDGYAKPAPKSLREKSGKKAGGQIGHKGSGMQIKMEPNEVRQHLPGQCSGCPNEGKCTYSCTGTHYVYDIEVNTKLIAHKILATNCPLAGNARIEGAFPAEATSPKQYGTKLQALIGSLLTVGYVSVERTKQFVEGLGIPISTGTVQNMMDQCVQATAPGTEYIRGKIASFSELNCDETGVKVNGKLHWLHCVCTSQWSYFVIHAKRGSEAMDECGIIPALDNCTLIHDFWASYLKYNNVDHAFCNAHIERELVYAYESTHQNWAKQLKELLSEMCGRRHQLCAAGSEAFPPDELAGYYDKFDLYIQAGLEQNPVTGRESGKRGRIKKGKTRCLLERLRDYKFNILRFAKDWSIPFTNNEAERSIRFTKVKAKVSGGFRTMKGAEGFASVMSFVSTAKKHGVLAFDALHAALTGNAVQLAKSWD